MRRSPVFYLFVFASLALPAQAQQQPGAPGRGAILTVKGVARIDMKPDYARLRVTVSTQAPALDEATRAHRDRATRALSVLEGLKADGIEIERGNFELNRNRPVPAPSNPAPPPFTAKTTFFLKTKAIDNLNAMITKLAASGLFEVFSFHFGIEQERAALNQARRQAIADARDQAAVYADAANLQLAEIAEITDGYAAQPPDGAADMPIARSVQIVPPDTVAFDASVQVTWRIVSR